MITKDQNERLTRVGPGTPMGALMRRYWQPVGASADLVGEPVKQVRILGETLVLYRDRQGRLGLVGERCPHQGVAMIYGMPEAEGLRCCYHGWLFDQSGRCIDLGEDAMTSDPTLQERVRITAYPVEELGGLVFAYLGPQPAPLLPRWEPLVKDGVQRSIGVSVVPCNWLQCLENQVGDSHVEWMHTRFSIWVHERLGTTPQRAANPDYIGYSAAEDFCEFERFEFGMLKTRTGGETSNPIVLPNMQIRAQIQYYVPMDDTHTWTVRYGAHDLPPGLDLPVQDTVPVFEYPLPELDERSRPAWSLLDINAGQDRLMLYARGEIADRTQEELGTGSKGIVMLRELLEENMQKIERGEDPIALVRDPARNDCIRFGDSPEDGVPARRRGEGEGRPVRFPGDPWDPVLREIRAAMVEKERALAPR